MRNCRNYKWNYFFLLEICIHYFLYREFSSPTWKKSPPPKVPILWPKSLLYKCSEKWLSPSPSSRGEIWTMRITAVNVKSLGMACLYLATAAENFLGISTEEEILASQPGSSYFLYCWLPSGRLFPPITTRYVLPRPWACLEIFSLHPLQKKLSTHLQGVCDTVEVSHFHKKERSTMEWVLLA